MKKIALYSLLAMSAIFTGCDEVEDPTGKPAVNTPIPEFNINDFKVSTPIVNQGELDLKAINGTDNKAVTVITVDDASNLPEGYELHFNYEIAASDDFTDAVTLPVAMAEGSDGSMSGTVTTAQLETAYEEIFGLSAAPEVVYARTAAYAYNTANKSTVRIGGDSQFYNGVSYTLTPDPVFVLYTPGDSNGWNQSASQQMWSDNGYSFMGYAHLQGGFKFTTKTDWSGVNYGQGDNAGELSTDGGAGNLTVDTDGLYWCTVNTTDLTYTASYISTYGVIGDFNNWSASVALTPSADFLVWTGTVDMSAGGQFKFRANDDWKISLGNTLDELLDNSQTNIPVPEPGIYDITLDLSSYPCKATMVKK